MVFNDYVFNDEKNVASCGLSNGSIVMLFIATKTMSHNYCVVEPALEGYVPNAALPIYTTEKKSVPKHENTIMQKPHL